VLIVDDVPINVQVQREFMKAWGMRVMSASHGAQALALLKEAVREGDPFRVAIFDFLMPGMDGEMLARAVRDDPSIADMSLVLATSAAQRGDADRFHRAGFNAYLTKPFRPETLLNTLEAIVSGPRGWNKNVPIITRHALNERRRPQAGAAMAPGTGGEAGEPAYGEDAGDEADAIGALERIVALPSPRERRTALRLRAAELLSLLEGVAPDVAEAEDARIGLLDELARLGASAVAGADAARAAGLDPLTLRTVALDAGVGANLLAVAPLPGAFSYTQFDRYDRCPLRYALQHVYRVPTAETVAAFTFGSTAHAAFEAFTKERRERAARGDPPPTREDLGKLFAAEWKPTGFPDATSEQTYRRRTASLLDNFWDGELSSAGTALHEELPFELRLDPGDESPVVRIVGGIDRIDRLPSGGIEILDYKTGKPGTQKTVDESLQLSIYALACRDTLGLGTPERVILYYTEAATRMSTTRTDDELDAARDELLARAAQVRSGDFRATPSKKTCGWCDYRAICPSRAE